MTEAKKKKPARELISIIIPCYNEEEVIEQCHSAVTEVIDALPYDFEIIYINDGSRDNTRSMLDALHKKDKRAKIFHLSRNFGKEAAMTAGLDHAKGDAVIILDADLQDPPHLIPEMLRLWKEEKADVVYGQRLRRQGGCHAERKPSMAGLGICRAGHVGWLSWADLPALGGIGAGCGPAGAESIRATSRAPVTNGVPAGVEVRARTGRSQHRLL